MADTAQISHGHTIAGIILCTVAIIVATPIVRFFMEVFGGWPNTSNDGWLPFVVIRYGMWIFFELSAAIAVGYISIIMTGSLIKRSDLTVVTYSVVTLYVCLLCVLYFLAYWRAAPLRDPVGPLIQLAGTILGLAIGRTR